MYVYLDETTFGNGDKYSGYASFIVKEKVPKQTIVEALINLKKDPDRHKKKFRDQDERTLERKFFHAADDSQNAHSHFCDSINKNIKGEFHSQFFHKRKSAFKSPKEAYDLASKLSILSVFSESPEVTFIFEERNDLTESYLKDWWENLWEDIFKDEFSHPYIRTYYPMLKLEIVNKSEPGLQVVDFILWSSTRQTLQLKCPWMKRIKYSYKTETKPDDLAWGGHSLVLGDMEMENKANYDISDYKYNDEKLNSKEYLLHYIVSVQKVINTVSKDVDINNVRHFWEEVEYLEANKIAISNTTHIEKMAICFLKLFDNISLINSNTPTDEKAFWIHCRKCFSYALNTNMVSGRRHSILLSNIRNNIIEREPEMLEQYPK